MKGSSVAIADKEKESDPPNTARRELERLEDSLFFLSSADPSFSRVDFFLLARLSRREGKKKIPRLIAQLCNAVR